MRQLAQLRIAWRSSSSASSRCREEGRCERSSRSESESPTRRCWAPSWRSRSSRLRSTSPASTIRARDARSSASRARTSAWRRSFSSASRAVAVTSSTSSLVEQPRSMREHRHRPAVAEQVRAFLSVSNLDAAAVRVDERSRVPDRVPEDEPASPTSRPARLAALREAATAPARRPTVRPTRGRVAPAPSPRRRPARARGALPPGRATGAARAARSRGAPVEAERTSRQVKAEVDGATAANTGRAPPRRGSNESQETTRRRRSDAQASPRYTPSSPSSSAAVAWSAISTRLSGHALQPWARRIVQERGTSTPRMRIAPT